MCYFPLMRLHPPSSSLLPPILKHLDLALHAIYVLDLPPNNHFRFNRAGKEEQTMDITAMVRPVNGGAGGGGGGGYGCVAGYSSEEELSVLPRHTKVVVTGNNRTKSVLVGLQGVVKKAVGLGGWHWLVLTNGIEVKLQRNALSVIEPATGHEDDGIIDMDENEIDCEATQWNNNNNNNNNNSDIVSCDHNNNNANNDDDSQKQHHRRRKPHRTPAIHKSISKLPITASKSSMKVDLSKLEADTLSRYRRYFNLVDATGPNPSKDQLLEAVQRHFTSQKMDEFQVIAGFLNTAKRLKNLCT